MPLRYSISEMMLSDRGAQPLGGAIDKQVQIFQDDGADQGILSGVARQWH